ncbi:MAG: alanine racemase [Bacillota bacterium]
MSTITGSDENNRRARAWVEVDRAAIASNVRALAELARPARVMAVVKADGYGHGAVEVARTALSAGAQVLAVATTPEGLALRRAGLSAPILVFGVEGAAEPVAELVSADLTATVTTEGFARRLALEAARQRRTVRVHLKVETGMGRLGALPDEAVDLARLCASAGPLTLEGIYSHLATADEEDPSYLRLQARRFAAVLDALESAGLRPPVRHLVNTAGLLAAPELRYDMVRLGLGLYGYYPAPHLRGRATLRPALRLVAAVTEVRRMPAGSGISYGRTHVTTRATTIATLPVGYADGFTRRLSNRARALWNGCLYPVVGRICMDQCMVDTGDDVPPVGAAMCLLGPGNQGEMTVDEAAQISGSIPYEIVTQLGPRLPRLYP